LGKSNTDSNLSRPKRRKTISSRVIQRSLDSKTAVSRRTKARMTDAKLLHLAVVAYDEMIARWRARSIPSRFLPGAMAVIASGERLYFASSVRTVPGGVKLANVPQGSVRELMDEALTMGIGTHSHGGGCGEINCLELFTDFNTKGQYPVGPPNPPVGPPKPRVAIWVLPRERQIDTNSEINAAPCTWKSRANPGYGCQEVALAYNLDPIDSTVAPDAAGDNWDFILRRNVRPPCQS